MTVYNVSGTIAVLAVSEEAGLGLLREKARVAEMDVYDEQFRPNMSDPVTGHVATGVLSGLFEAESEQAALGRFMRRVFARAGALPRDVVAFESENVPRGWVR